MKRPDNPRQIDLGASPGRILSVSDLATPKVMADAIASNARIGGSRMIEYEGLHILAPVRDIELAMSAFRDGDRHRIMVSVRRSIRRLFPRVKRGTASQKEAMDCAQDIAIWFANEIVEGRQTSSVH